MGKRTVGHMHHRRAVNQLMIHTPRIPERLRLSPAAYLRALRVYLRLSQEELAAACGVNQANIARFEAGTADPRLKTLRRLFDALSCDLLILPLPRRRLGDVVSERELAKWGPDQPWKQPPPL